MLLLTASRKLSMLEHNIPTKMQQTIPQLNNKAKVQATKRMYKSRQLKLRRALNSIKKRIILFDATLTQLL
eukprot:snap_masked-scaffold_11-processed-gene-3.8-mRNA-1 protein AED:1.00 eAED:1.00 QI:0/0/0/0/1/1/2/0/70